MRIYTRKIKQTASLPIFLLLGIFMTTGAFFARGASGNISSGIQSSGISNVQSGGFGGPDEPAVFDAVSIDTQIEDGSFFGEGEDVRFVLVEKTSALSLPSPQTDTVPQENGLMVYKVKEGDTLSHIAANFGISVDTILNANQSLKSTVIRPGQELVLLPVVGLLYEVKEGENVDSIAALYGIQKDSVLEANPDRHIAPGESIIIPGVKPPKRFVYGSSSSGANLPSYPGYYGLPAQGWNWGVLHAKNAVDIANACGTPIFASAEGLVTESVAGGWNSGYGSYVVIEHPNGTKTKYAHTSRNAVSTGMYVNRGDAVASIGNTGNTHGPTGCHLHFEVLGAVNPFAK